jgi:hypothetical protein
MEVGDKVRVIKRILGNHTGGVNFNLINGDVGTEGVITLCRGDNIYTVHGIIDGTNRYIGVFQGGIEIELISKTKPYYEIY